MNTYKRVLAGGVMLAGLVGFLGSPVYASESLDKPGIYEYYDIDGDGHRDRLYVEVDEYGKFMTYMDKNNGQGSYASSELLITLERVPLNLYILDFDKDGDIDLLFTYPVTDLYHDSGNYVARNDGKGHFETIERLPRDY
ncbi:MAG: VCBS repeat-containing protein [Deltaproteobacteria bacterium]|nr:VCBS repeat-containing protein [Deltaproteobacteria bacterium]